ncbi:hypothetical protein Intca_3151 [Intrasporangium calvum DSM 43043]|uniref:Uncharacterized protein n=2 Tax=Intrasporangium calvum TaxID=53358 RepID=E6SCN2_INTC7|nr:hypothetical protein Intca_3151 [Intrasporangium calvum DSM 43043]
MTNKRHRAVRRNATRRRPVRSLRPDTASEQGPTSVSGVLAPDLDGLGDAAAAVTASLASEIARVRTPLAAELVLCQAFRVMEMGAPKDADEQERLEARSALLGQVIAHAETLSTPDALAVLRVCATLGPDVTRQAAGQAAARVAAAGVADRPWAESLGRPHLLRAWHYGDVFGSQTSAGALFDYRGRDHLLMVLIDHDLGGGVKDCWVAEGRRAREMRDAIAARMASDDAAFFEDIDAAGFAELLGSALAKPPCPRQVDQVEDVATYFYLTRSRADHVARLAGA